MANRRIVSAGENGSVMVWDAATGRTAFSYTGHGRAVITARWSHDGRRIA